MRRTKIVCTIGPASESIPVLKEMLAAGMDVARLNFSHGSHEEHLLRLRNIRQASREIGRPVAILLDTKGPEIRIGELEESLQLEAGQDFCLTTIPDIRKNKVYVNYPGLPGDVKPGDRILIDDGLIGLVVKEVTSTEINCLVENGGELSGRKGVNVPGVSVNLPSVTEKDLEDILFGIEQEVDFIAASFVRTAADVLEIRKVLEDHHSPIQVIAKIETQAAVDNIDDILEVSDGIMVARGDLGVEIPAEEVPLAQKQIIAQCNLLGKPVITATQMLDSMIRNPRPTRAEASDVANAIIDGTDAVMLSGETAAGKYPVEAVKTMARIGEKTENVLLAEGFGTLEDILAEKTITGSIGHATYTVAQELDAEAIITPTTSGSTARMVARHRPQAPIVAGCPNPVVCRQLLLVWGVIPVLTAKAEGTDEIISTAVKASLDSGVVKLGDLVVITAGVPAGIAGTTNLLKVHVVGEVVAKGQGIGRAVVTAPVRLCRSAGEALQKVEDGDILVTYGTDKDFVPAMEKAGAIITTEGGLTSHAAVVGLSIGVPVVVGVPDGMEVLRDGEVFTIDGATGQVYKGVTKVL
jgi:pyruvate kinase